MTLPTWDVDDGERAVILEQDTPQRNTLIACSNESIFQLNLYMDYEIVKKRAKHTQPGWDLNLDNHVDIIGLRLPREEMIGLQN